MKHKFLNKLWLRVGMIVAVMTTALSSTAWGQTTYKLEQVTSVEAGGLYVFEQGGYVMINTISSSALQTTNTYKTTGLTGTETYVWTLEAATDGYYMKNVSLGSSPYLRNDDGTKIVFNNNKTSQWVFNFQIDNTVLIQNKSYQNRFLGWTTKTSHVYKAYAANNLDSGNYPHAIKVYQLVEEGGTSSAVATTTTIDATGITNTDVYTSTTAGSLSATVKDESSNIIAGASVTWTSSDKDVATIDANGNVTLVAAGTTTITASYAGVENEYEASSATYELTVTDSDPNKPGTAGNPYTVAQAKANTPDTGSSEDVYIRGIVSSFFKTDIVSDGNNYRYYISDDGTTTGQLLVYKGKGLNQATFASADDLKVGDNVVIYGKLTTYNNEQEIASGNYLVSLVRPVIPVESHTLTIANSENVTITATYGEGEDAPVLQNGENGEVEEGAEVTIALTVASGYKFESLTITGAGEGQTITPTPAPNAEGVYTFTMPAYNVTVSASVSEIATGTHIYELVSDASTLVAGDVIIIAYNTATIHKAMGAQRDNNRAAVDVEKDGNRIIAGSDVQQITLEGNAAGWYFNVDNNYLYAASSSSNHLKTKATKDDNAKATISISSDYATITFQGTNTRNKIMYNNTSELFSCYASGQKPVQIYKLVEYESVSVGDLKYSTYASDNALDFTGSSIKAFYPTVDGTTLIFHEITKVPARTGVLLYSANGAITEDILVCTGETDAAEYNVFVRGTDASVTYNDATQEYIYVLSKPQGDNLGFYKANNNKVAKNRAYIKVPAELSGAKSFTINLEDDPTGIVNLNDNVNANEEAIYNLAGQRLSKMQKGINIINGKKVLK